MASAKTNSFYIRETIDVDTSTTLDNIDLSLYVDPVNKQALLVKNVDFIWALNTFLPAPAAAYTATCQLHDTTLGALREFDNQHQVASGGIVGTTSSVSSDVDFFPDRLGMAKGEGRIIVNDSMEIATLGIGVNAAQQVTVVMECQVVKLTEKDYITLAMQQVADN
jgi:hypothetical protein|tara:strand:- start:196 stop:693 length:498 start_codon:yes stop_codon:yes gene_type:complete